MRGSQPPIEKAEFETLDHGIETREDENNQCRGQKKIRGDPPEQSLLFGHVLSPEGCGSSCGAPADL